MPEKKTSAKKTRKEEVNEKRAEAQKLEKKAADDEHYAELYGKEATRREFYKDGALGQIFGAISSNETDPEIDEFKNHASKNKDRAKDARAKADSLRAEADAVEEAPIESVLDDLAPYSAAIPKDKDTETNVDAQIESVLGDIGPASYVKKEKTALIVVGVGLLLGGALFFSGTSDEYDDEEDGYAPDTVWVTGPDGIAVPMPGKRSGEAMTIDDVADFSTLVPEEPIVPAGDGSAEVEGKKYYVVTSTDPARDTGSEVCAIHGKQCVGYTDYTLSSCLAFHPGATPSKDLNGSKAGFYCNGAPQGGVCAEESNTCHICPECNVNMDCNMEIGILYRETFVECS